MTNSEGTPGVGGKHRITVSLDAEIATGLKLAAQRSGAASLSEYVQTLLADRLARDAWMAAWIERTGQPDPEAMAYARRSLLSHAVSPRARAS
ncbi:MAG: hypothetical protein JO100_12435 [Pseudonocardia sp.]|nr:hypothetical protein [Pseudonocardia sp.]